MINETITEGPSVAEALDSALEEMGVQQDAVEYEVLEEPGHGLFGRATGSAKVRVWLKGEFLAEMQADKSEGPEDDDGEGAMAPAGSVDPGTEEEPELTDEELDAVADVGSEVITAVLQKFGIDATVEEYEGDEGELILDIVGDDLAVLIGRHGRTLDALQVLVSAATNRRLERRYPVTIDISGYRHRRRLKIEEIARRAADRASRQHRPVSMRPMSGLERRMVHIALRGDRRVTTESEGQEPNRCVVVHPH